MNKEVVKVMPNCIEKLGKLTPAKLREIRKFTSYALPFSVLGGAIYCIYKERMTDKQYKHEEIMADKQYKHEEMMFQMKHEEIMAEIKANLLSRAEERKNEKDN